jgi:hypothetical protein
MGLKLTVDSRLCKRVSLDQNWRVQEILAKAFGQYCEDRGYENPCL